jgi:hypothetical protein|tara:strand:- start:311 stop:1000 length:690 start_codon:yes stop_codon:yes gene_type:complete
MSKEFDKFCNQVFYTENLDGAGRWLARFFEQVIRKENTIYDNLLEVGCGPSWIGLWLQKKGLCHNLHLTDINPQAIEAVSKTLKNNNIKATTYLSDLFNNIPEDIKFDCIVSNPPNYFDIQDSHSVYGYLSNDIRPSDRDWKFHKEFYKQVAGRLTEDGVIFISEINMYSDTVVFLNEIYDKRKRPAIDDFEDMIKSSGLIIKDVVYLTKSTNEFKVPVHLIKVGKCYE